MVTIKHPALDTVRRNSKYFEEIHTNVWLMDNHKWAFFIWEDYRYRNPGKFPSTLVHIDYHWDGINDIQEPEKVTNLLNINNSKGIRNLIARDSLVRYDSFIAPAIIRGIVKEVHFYCFQSDGDDGLENDLLQRYKAKQFIHSNIDTLIQGVSGKSVVFDIDLDIFNRSDKWDRGDIWAEEDILSFIDKCSGLIANSSLITIAMSFDYSGTAKDAKYLARLLVPKIIQNFQNKG